MLKKEILNLNEAWLVCKKYNGKLYFVGKYSRDDKKAEYAKIFSSKENANLTMATLNANRKKVKYFLEPANKHFITTWDAGANWLGETILCTKAYSLEEAIRNKLKTDHKFSTKAILFNKTSERLKASQQKLAELDNFFKERLQQLQADVKQRQEDLEVNIKAQLSILSEIETIDFEKLFKENETPLETTYKVLYEKD